MPAPLGLKLKENANYTCLVVDDSHLSRMSFVRTLNSESFKVVGDFANGIDLMRFVKFAHTLPDILFIDISTEYGLDSIRDIRSVNSEIKIVVVSMHNSENLVKELVKLKVNGFILKPFDRAQVIQKIARILNRNDLLEKTVIGYKSTVLNLNDIKIPPIPSVMCKILTFDADNPNGGSTELERIINPDKAITSNILRIANSAYYGRAGSITTLKDAITLIGVKSVKNLVIHLSVKNTTKQLKGELFEKYLKELPILTALLAFDIATPLGYKNIRDQLFLSALLLKIGMNVLALNYADRYSKVLYHSELYKIDLLAQEKKEFNINSWEIGVHVFNLWNMPSDLKEVLTSQNIDTSNISSINDIARIVKLADILSQKLLGIEQSPSSQELESKIFEYYKADEDLKDVFGEDYLELIKEHPFFSITMN